jgi:hypothetical protein
MIRHAHAAGEETRNSDMLPADPFPTEAPDVIEPHRISVPGL